MLTLSLVGSKKRYRLLFFEFRSENGFISGVQDALRNIQNNWGCKYTAVVCIGKLGWLVQKVGLCILSFVADIWGMLVLQFIIYCLSLTFVVFLILAIRWALAMAWDEDRSLKTLSYRMYSDTARKFIKCFSGFAITVVVCFACVFSFKLILWKRVERVLNAYNAATGKVYINGKVTDNGADVVNALRKPFHAMANHSGPYGRLDVTIVSGNDTAELIVRRDSRSKDQYWIFYEKYKFSSENSVRRMKTNVFDRYSQYSDDGTESGGISIHLF